MTSSLDTLYRGPLEQLKALGPTPARRFSAGPDHFYYTHRHELIQHPYGGPPESIFACQEGSLVYPLYTPQGILVTQEDCTNHHLWLVNPQTKEAGSCGTGPEGVGLRLRFYWKNLAFDSLYLAHFSGMSSSA